MSNNSPQHLCLLFAITLLLCIWPPLAPAQSGQSAPLTSQELVRLVYQFHDKPQTRDDVINEIRQRGLGFELTSGLRSVIATKSGNDPVLRRTIEEASRRRLNPTAASLPSASEAADVLMKAKVAALQATQAMPDFVVRQLITRSIALGRTQNWHTMDRLTLAVSYRASTNAEDYKLLAVNGLPPAAEARPGQNFMDQVGGTTSTGEYVSLLAQLFADESRASFQATDTDTIRGRRTIVYDYEVKLPYSRETIKSGTRFGSVSTQAGYRGRVWIDRENFRVLRIESAATEIPQGFPVTAAARTIDYDWTTIADQKYLLPVRAEVVLTARYEGQEQQTRNEIRFRNYQKFGSELKIIEDDEPVEDATTPPKKTDKQP